MSTRTNSVQVPVTEQHLEKFLNSQSSSFEFELKTLRILREAGFSCEHSGFYTDPQTGKLRQFDIRARKKHHLTYGTNEAKGYIAAAIECKHLKPTYPLVAYRTPRTSFESFHDVFSTNKYEVFATSKKDLVSVLVTGDPTRRTTLRIRNLASTYRPGEPVARSFEQVGVTEISEKDTVRTRFDTESNEMYDKYSQAINQGTSLVLEQQGIGVLLDSAAVARQRIITGHDLLVGIVPIVVVPDGTLWAVDYDDDGNRSMLPSPQKNISMFLDREISARSGLFFSFSHIEFCTISSLVERLTQLHGTNDKEGEMFEVLSY
jgi:hypothetical protein